MTRPEMDALTRSMSTKSEKIRALTDAGAAKQAIADYLGISYQHVYTVLRSRRPKSEPSKDGWSAQPQPSNSENLTIDAAKRGLAAHFAVPVDAIEITIRG